MMLAEKRPRKQQHHTARAIAAAAATMAAPARTRHWSVVKLIFATVPNNKLPNSFYEF